MGMGSIYFCGSYLSLINPENEWRRSYECTEEGQAEINKLRKLKRQIQELISSGHTLGTSFVTDLRRIQEISMTLNENSIKTPPDGIN